jgi:hypothetical protein
MNKDDFLKQNKTGNSKEIILKSKKPGRKPKSEESKESETLVLKITKGEMQVILDKAGAFPLSTWFKNEVRTKTDIFNGQNT